MDRGLPPTLNAAQQHVHPPFRQALGVLADRGEPGNGEAGHGDAVVAHHGDVLRHPLSPVPQGPDGPDGHDVAHGENGRQVRAAVQQTLRGGVGVGHGIAAGLALALRVEGQAQPGKRPAAALQAAVADLGTGPVAPQEADAAVALPGQELDDLGGGLAVVGGQGGEIIKV